MNRKYTIAILAVLVMFAGCSGVKTWSAKEMEEDVTGETLVEEPAGIRDLWEIRVAGGHSREYITTNKVATHFSCETNSRNRRSYHGLYCAMHEYLDSWDFHNGNSLLKPDEVYEDVLSLLRARQTSAEQPPGGDSERCVDASSGTPQE